MIRDLATVLIASRFGGLRPLRRIGAQAAERLAARHQLRISVGPIRLARWDTVVLTHVSIASERYAIALTADTIRIQLDWRRSTRRQPYISSVELQAPQIDVTKRTPTPTPSAPRTPRRRQSDHYKTLNRLLQRYESLVPDTASCTDLRVRLHGHDVCRAASASGRVSIAGRDQAGGRQTSVDVQLSSRRWWLDHAKIAPAAFEIERFDLDTSAVLQDHSLTIRETSSGRFNRLDFSVFFEHQVESQNVVSARCAIEKASPAEVLRSLPFVTHSAITDITAVGAVGLEALLSFNMHDRRHHQFSTDVIYDGFRVEHPGTRDLQYLKGPFEHHVHANDVLVKRILVDPANADFVPLADIAPDLVNTILCTEDPGFYSHQGIDSTSIGWAIVANVRYKKYLRGGSTITMQLVRNLFLGHDKNLARKVEEMILAWHIERHVQLGKQRILEIYLNIIELAPDVYGIADACRFYFDKQPRDLSVAESLVLSYIIPRPKFFPEAVLMRSPTMISKLKRHFAVYGAMLRDRGHITDAQLRSLPRQVQFAGSLGTLTL